jgi:hypothetical protein
MSRETTYVGFHGGNWAPKRRTEVDAVATLQYGLNGLVWDIPSRNAPRGLTGKTLHPAVLDKTIFEWFFNTLMPVRHVIGIDAPFGWPTEFRSFIDGELPSPMPEVGDIKDNPVLYRDADRFAYELLGVKPNTMLDRGDSVTKVHTVIRILQERLRAHIAYVGRSKSGRWRDLDTIILETDPVCAEFEPTFKRRRRSLFARINKELAASKKPRLKTAEKAALSSALIALELDALLCSPLTEGTGNPMYIAPEGLLPDGDMLGANRSCHRPEHGLNMDRSSDGRAHWTKYFDSTRLATQGLPAYPIDPKKYDRVAKKSRRK